MGNSRYARPGAPHRRARKGRCHRQRQLRSDQPRAYGQNSRPEKGDLLVIGWGGTYGSTITAVQRAQRKGSKVAQAHLRYLNPMPRNVGDVLKRYKKILV